MHCSVRTELSRLLLSSAVPHTHHRNTTERLCADLPSLAAVCTMLRNFSHKEDPFLQEGGNVPLESIRIM